MEGSSSLAGFTGSGYTCAGCGMFVSYGGNSHSCQAPAPTAPTATFDHGPLVLAALARIADALERLLEQLAPRGTD